MAFLSERRIVSASHPPQPLVGRTAPPQRTRPDPRRGRAGAAPGPEGVLGRGAPSAGGTPRELCMLMSHSGKGAAFIVLRKFLSRVFACSAGGLPCQPVIFEGVFAGVARRDKGLWEEAS